MISAKYKNQTRTYTNQSKVNLTRIFSASNDYRNRQTVSLKNFSFFLQQNKRLVQGSKEQLIICLCNSDFREQRFEFDCQQTFGFDCLSFACQFETKSDANKCKTNQLK